MQFILFRHREGYRQKEEKMWWMPSIIIFTEFSLIAGMPIIPPDNGGQLTVTQMRAQKFLIELEKDKAPGPDGLTIEIRYLDISGCAVILMHILNLSLHHSMPLQEWKTANVTPIFKSGHTCLPSNYRPVSLTCICCKLLQHIVLHSVSPQLDKILGLYQHGFRKNLSCAAQLVTVQHDLANCIDNRVYAAMLDFSKALTWFSMENI